MAILLNSDGKIDENTKVNDKILDEKEYRNRLCGVARQLGCLKDFLILLNKFETMMRNCTNDQERKGISELGVVEIYKLLGSHGPLSINGKMVFEK